MPLRSGLMGQTELRNDGVLRSSHSQIRAQVRTEGGAEGRTKTLVEEGVRRMSPPDSYSRQKRSEVMSRVRSKDTKGGPHHRPGVRDQSKPHLHESAGSRLPPGLPP